MSLNLVLGIVLIIWWLSQGYSDYPWFNEAGNWNLFDQFSNATVLTQWGAVLLVAILLNRWFYRKFVDK
jgi:NSS family neurotransmitter:Na+ symporter